jgi:hypothetical protein
MNIDNINDVEVLRNELKNHMIKCKKDFIKDGSVFHKDEYYDIEQDEDLIYMFDDYGTLVTLEYNEAEEYLYK